MGPGYPVTNENRRRSGRRLPDGARVLQPATPQAPSGEAVSKQGVPEGR